MSDGSHERIEQVRELVVDPGQEPQRIDTWIVQRVARATRTKVQEAIAGGAVLVNGQPTRANYRVRPNDVIRLTLLKPPPIVLTPQPIPLTVLYEDEDLLIIDKPAGMVTHPGYGNRDGTLVNAVLYHVGGALPASEEAAELEEQEEGEVSPEEEPEAAGDAIDTSAPELRPGIVHRLDKDTSGVMVVARTAEAQVFLARQFAERTASREYVAILWGVVKEDEGEIEGNLGRDPRDRKRFVVTARGGRWALTRYRVLERFEFATLVALRLATGRTHQIRVHCAHIHHPVFGDPVYGGRSVVVQGSGGRHRQRIENLLARLPRQALHARMLGIRHPRTLEFMEFHSEPPEDMTSVLDSLRAAD